jgi:putative SOS response-associated peptidase YedK
MCSDYRLIERIPAEELFDILETPEGIPNFEPREDIRITDRAPIVRMSQAGMPELVQRRWSWPGPGGKPVYNFRSEGREFQSGRCLILADGFYEFTAHSDPKSKRKHKRLFTLKDQPWFAVAGLWRTDPGGRGIHDAHLRALARRRALPQPLDRRAAAGRMEPLARYLDPGARAADAAAGRQPLGRAGQLMQEPWQ